MSLNPLLIVGGSGLLGRALVNEAQAADFAEVHATYLDADLAGNDPEWPIWHRLDLRRVGAIEALIDDIKPAAVINAAYVQRARPGGDQAELQAITAEAPGRMAAAGSGIGGRFVHISSDIVFPGRASDEGGPAGYREEDAAGPINEYGKAKADSEAAVMAADPSAAILRTSLLWGGAGDGGAQIRLVRDPEVQFFTDEFRNPLRVDRLAVASLEVAARPEITGLLHVAGADRVDRLTFARAIAPRVGVDPEHLRGREAGDPDRAADCALDSSRARALLRSPLPGVFADAD